MRSNHEREARVIYLLTTDRQTVNYYSTIHALELIYFDSNTQETMKKQFILQILSAFRHCTDEFWTNSYHHTRYEPNTS